MSRMHIRTRIYFLLALVFFIGAANLTFNTDNRIGAFLELIIALLFLVINMLDHIIRILVAAGMDHN